MYILYMVLIVLNCNIVMANLSHICIYKITIKWEIDSSQHYNILCLTISNKQQFMIVYASKTFK